jgi:hypothetical protein
MPDAWRGPEAFTRSPGWMAPAEDALPEMAVV